MSIIIGQTIIYALEEAINKQEKINQTLLNSNLDDRIADGGRYKLSILNVVKTVD
jgi:hypothetical protein